MSLDDVCFCALYFTQKKRDLFTVIIDVSVCLRSNAS